MLGHGYIVIDQIEVPNPISYSYEQERTEQGFTDQSGNESVFLIGSPKYRASMTFQCTSRVKRMLEGFYSDGVAVTVTVGAITYTNVFVASFSADLEKGSETTANTNGLWTVSLSLRQL